MGLLQVATSTVTSAVASVTLTGIDSDDVYMLAISKLIPVSDSFIQLRVTESGTANSTSNYDYARLGLNSDASFDEGSDTNQSAFPFIATVESSTSGTGGNAICYLYNFNNSSEFSFITSEEVHFHNNGNARGFQGGLSFTSQSSCDGVNIFANSGNIASGTFTLFKII